MTASVALMTVTQNQWPNGLDTTQRRQKVYATAVIQASTQFYTTGGLALALGGSHQPRINQAHSIACESHFRQGKKLCLHLVQRGQLAAKHCSCRRPIRHRFQRKFAAMHDCRNHQQHGRTDLEPDRRRNDNRWNRSLDALGPELRFGQDSDWGGSANGANRNNAERDHSCGSFGRPTQPGNGFPERIREETGEHVSTGLTAGF